MTERRIETVLCELADRHGDRTALVSDRGGTTYDQLQHAALGLARRLRELGVGEGDRVVLLAPNSEVFVAAFFGVLMTGAVVASMSPDSGTTELEAMVETAAPAAAVVVRRVGDRDFAQELDGILPSARVWVDDPTTVPWEPSTDRAVVVDRDPDAPALVAFTSGSTGRPKGAVHRACTLVHTGERYLADVLDGRPSVLLASLPLYHLGGMTLLLFPALYGGGSLVLMDGFRVDDFVDRIERHRVDVVMAIPAMMELLFLRARLEDRDLSCVRTITLGGSAVPNRLVRQCAEQLNSVVHVGYGLTECPGFCIISSPDDSLDELGPYVGRATEGYEVSIRDDAGASVAPGELGEVCLRSRYTLLEYLDDPEATAAVMDDDGWFHTGDLGVLGADGRLYIQGRKKEMYIRGGFNVYPREVEDALGTHPAVSQVAIHAIPDTVLGERGYAWVVLEDGATATEEDLRAHLVRSLAYYKAPDVIRFAPELPMNAIGKTDKKALRQRLVDEGTIPADDRAGTPRVGA